MTQSDDLEYFLRRAQQERDLAEQSAGKPAEICHRELAEAYERRAARARHRLSPVYS